eukprot:SAG11_NODE_35051_length_268_cov_1.526627_1_plen_31_part_10
MHGILLAATIGPVPVPVLTPGKDLLGTQVLL